MAGSFTLISAEKKQSLISAKNKLANAKIAQRTAGKKDAASKRAAAKATSSDKGKAAAKVAANANAKAKAKAKATTAAAAQDIVAVELAAADEDGNHNPEVNLMDHIDAAGKYILEKIDHRAGKKVQAFKYINEKPEPEN